MELVEYDDIKIFTFYSLIHEESMRGKMVCSFLHEPEDIYYFAYFRDFGTDTDNRCRISMTEPKYLDSDFILTAEERDLIIKILTEYNVWDQMIEIERSERKECGFSLLPDNMIMPDYNLLEIINV